MADIDSYLQMQKSEYARTFREHGDGAVVGSYDFHENVPYETLLLHRYGDVRRPIFNGFAGLTALDYGCGEGRMIRRLSGIFERVDGVDISEDMAANARARCPGSNVWVTSGRNCADAPSDAYDFVYSTISIQHIGSFDVRDSILHDLKRVLKPGGKGTLQMLFAKDYPFRAMNVKGQVGNTLVEIMPLDDQHAGWFENKFDAERTNSGCDTVIGAAQLPQIRTYLETMFKDVEFWFHDISIGRGGQPRILDATHPNSHLDDGYWGTHFIFLHFTKP
jgi:ubiquinone/menaquinone biosynthesis C-methylase UbiE